MPWKNPEDRRAHYAKHRERMREQKRRDYYAHREERIAAVTAAVDPEAKREYDQAYNQRPDVRARRAEQRRAWGLAHPEYVTSHNKARSQARRGARPDATAKSYMAVLISDLCSYCGRPCEQIDHIVPLKHRGDSDWSNLTAACQSCNYAKRDKSLLTFLLSVPSGGSY